MKESVSVSASASVCECERASVPKPLIAIAIFISLRNDNRYLYFGLDRSIHFQLRFQHTTRFPTSLMSIRLGPSSKPHTLSYLMIFYVFIQLNETLNPQNRFHFLFCQKSFAEISEFQVLNKVVGMCHDDLHI